MDNLVVKNSRKVLIQSNIMKLLMHENSTILDEIKKRTACVDTTLCFFGKERFRILTEIGTLSEKQIILEQK